MKRIINGNINKSLKIINKEKDKIKEEKNKVRLEKEKKFYNTKFGSFLKDFFDISKNEKEVSKAIRRRIIYNFFSVFIGFILCLVILYILCDGKNYFKLYSELNDFIVAYDTISSEYNGKLNKEELVNSAINSMIESVGDVYTNYNNSEGSAEFYEDLMGSYEGIGCTVSENSDGNIYVVEVFKSTPAEKAGLKVNDIILSIDGIDYLNKTSDEMAEYVKHEAKNNIKFVILRDNNKLNLNMTREKVEISNVMGEVIEQDGKRIGYIRIGIFSAIANVQFENELKKLEKKNIDSLIIDVRNNNGGYLSVVTDITNLFLEKGKVIYQLETNGKREKIKDKTKESRNYPISIMVNVGSASASEILAVSMKESYGAYVIGTNTYGKGTVQKTKKLKDGSMIKYTVQNWLTPEGKYITENGISPTDVVIFEKKGFRNDSQLDYSVNLLKSVMK